MQQVVAETERDSKAVELYVKYSELVALPPTSDKDADFWRHNTEIVIAETIFRLRNQDSGWRATVGGMLQRDKVWLSQKHLGCETFSPAFVEFVSQSTGAARGSICST